ncbi:MAG: glutamate-cysteine ligase family protein [Candidatus Nanohaloarchaea archaeon]
MSAEREATVLDPEREEEMNRHLEQQAHELEEKQFEQPEGVNVGFETEYPVVWRGTGLPVDEDTRDAVIDELANVDGELGTAMSEIATEPLKGLKSLSQVEDSIREVERPLRNEARKQGAEILRYGAHPRGAPERIERTDKEKYQKVPEKYFELRDDDLVSAEFGLRDTLDLTEQAPPAYTFSTQLNMQVGGLDEAVEKTNLGYAIGAWAAAITGNSRFVGGRDLGLDDTRMPMWSRAFDIRDEDELEEGVAPDVGEIGDWYESWSDVVEDVRSQPRILNDGEKHPVAWDVGQGMNWKHCRPKVPYDEEEGGYIEEALVEIRPVSTQPTVEEEVAVHAFMLGRMLYAEQQDEDITEALDIEQANSNYGLAMHSGLDDELYASTGEPMDADEAVRYELLKAREGLRSEGIDDDEGYLDLLFDRLDRYQETGKGTHSDELAAELGDSWDGEQLYQEISSRGGGAAH